MVPQRRELEGCQKTKLRVENERDAKRLSSEERSLVRYHVVGRTYKCRRFVATHICCCERQRRHMTRGS